jgi:predicted ATPase/tRNA A-37 threonylcarbamoyl transferase component Bud32
MLTPMTLLAEALAGRYTIDREVGAGGQARVFLAQDLKHRRAVAIKVFRPELGATIGADHFVREIEIAARLNHPHILPLFDSGAARDLRYYVMPFVQGESLRDRLAREGRLATDEALRLAREVAAAIGFAHHSRIVHRDIKPENILLVDGIALVADFGIASALRAGQDASTATTVVGLALGTPAYMSPEQFTAPDVDGRSDIYSLGCVLYEMLAGHPPFTGATIDALYRQHLSTDPRPLNEVQPTVPGAVARVVAKALAKDPAGRFPTAAAFAEAMATAAAGRTPPDLVDATRITPTNLPRHRTHFIGRDQELAECARLLDESRLLTFTGIGGAGKTRLALRLAETLLPTFPDGVWLADLSSLVDPEHVATTVAAAVGAHEAADRPLLDVLADHVRGKRLLVLLDNCEHLLDGAATVADRLLAAGDGVRLLVTSREGLGIAGERLIAVRSMAVPTDPHADLHTVEASEAVRLFVDRAQATRSDFALTPDNAGAVVEICRRLDGIPLAIELAAARVKVLSVEQIRAKLNDRFRLLTGGRAAVPRQQTLLAAILWSWEQLSGLEQEVLRRLSVFAGGWTLDAATAVVDRADEFEVLDLLTHLVDKSLVIVEPAPDEARYHLLETVRQFGYERLLEAGEAERTRERHVVHFTALAARFYAERFEREETWTRRLTTEHDNVRAALSSARDRDPERYLMLVALVAHFWWARSHIAEGRAHLAAALAGAAPDPVRRSYALALRGHAMIRSLAGEAAAAREAMVRSLAMWRELGDPAETAVALEALGWAHFLSGEDEPARATFEELLRIQEGLGDAGMIIRAKTALAQALVALSRIEEARPLAREIVDYGRKVEDRRLLHSGLHYLADCALIEGDCAASLGSYAASLVAAEAIGDRVETSAEIEGVAMSLAGLGQRDAAVRLVAAARAEWARLGVDIRIPFWEALHERYMTPARAALGPDATAAAERTGRAMTFEDAVAAARAASRTQTASS